MALLATVDSLETVPEAVRDMYAEKDGKFHLSVEGLVPKGRLDEFRTNNVTLKREMDELRARFDGVDPDLHKELTAKAAKERDKKLIDAGKVDELVAERVNAMRAEHDKVVKSLADEKTAATRQLEGLLIDSAIRDAAAKAGVRATAIDDVLLRGRTTFKLHEGKATAFDGDKPVYGKDGEPVQIAEWVTGLTERAPHLFEQSAGAGGQGARGDQGHRPGTIERGSRDFMNNLDKIASGKLKVV